MKIRNKMGLEDHSDLPDFLTNNDAITLEEPGEFVGEGDPTYERSKFFKTSPNPVALAVLQKMPLHEREGSMQRCIKLVVTQENQEYKTSPTVGVLSSDGIRFLRNCLSHCGVEGCELSDLSAEEQARIAQALEVSIIPT